MRHIEEIKQGLSRFTAMVGDEIHDEPSAVDASDGAVLVKGPGNVEVCFTPSAAEETSERLLEAAMKARGQRYFEEDGC